MSQQILHEREAANITGCKQCSHYKNTEIFELCSHPHSGYHYDGRAEHHTCQHMRGAYGSDKCGPEMRLRK